jgi:exodeoxyribonuclease V alpha subunit
MAMPSPATQNREVLAGIVERVTFHSAETGFCVLRVKARGHRDLTTIVGHAATISAGEWITASGDWVNDRTHGQQFKAHFMRTAAPSSIDGIEKYLSSGMIRGIGPTYAKKMVKHSGRRCSTSSKPSLIDCARSMASARSAFSASQQPGRSRRSSAK